MKLEKRSGRTGTLGALLGFAVCASCSSPGEPSAVDASDPLAASAPGPAPATLAEGPASLRVAYVASRQADGLVDPRFHVTADALGLRTERNAGVDARFDETGIALHAEGGVAGRLETRAIRCGRRELARVGGAPVIDPVRRQRVTRRAGAGASEWYVNGPFGLEHGFDVELAGCARTLSVELATPGFVSTKAGADVRLTSRAMGVSLRYAHLAAYDREGRALPASFDVGDARIRISVDVAAALGPITIDPLIYFEEQRVDPDGDLGTFATFGHSLAMSADTALVGARLEEPGGQRTRGVVYVFVRNGPTWNQQATLVPIDGVTGDAFGQAVALSGDTALVGSGDKAYIFVRSGATWTQQARLTPSGGVSGGSFGFGVGLSGDTALVGASRADVGNGNQGAAYVFVRSGATWTQQARLTASDGIAEDEFGHAVALSGDTALVGAPAFHEFEPNPGAAYVFVRSGTTWSEQAKLTGSAPGFEYVKQFGWAVALSGDTALVGSPGDGYRMFETVVSSIGAAYVFVRTDTSWHMQQKLTATHAIDGDVGAGLGGAVALSGDIALLGAPRDGIGANVRRGAVDVFVRNIGTLWTGQATLTANDESSDDYFGASVAVATSPVWGTLTAVGAPLRGGFDGAVYFGRLADAEAPCRGVPAGTLCRASAGPCDVAETCDGTGEACPPDRLAAAGTTCSADTCRAPSTCTGDAPTCPDDRPAAAGTPCGSASDTACDDPDTCDDSGTCLPNHAPPTTTICRAAANDCDVAEMCDGDGVCPVDGFAPEGDVFGASAPCGAPGGCCGAGGGQASLWLALVVLASLGRRRIRARKIWLRATLTRATLVAVLAAPLVPVATVAHADDEIDVDRVEIIEVVETTDGSIWKGVIVEFVPGESIKIALSGGSVHVIPLGDIVRITRQKRPRRVAPARQAPPLTTRTAPSPARPRLPAPFPTSGMRGGIGLLAASPTGAWAADSSSTLSFAPSIQLGYERLYGKVTFSGGGRVTWIYFLSDQDSKDAFWTLEAHGYLRSTVHVSQVAVYAGLSLGLDTNFSGLLQMFGTPVEDPPS